MPLPWAQTTSSASRPAPTGDPPPYHPARYVRQYYGHSLRPVVLFCSALGFLFAIVSGVDDIRDSQDHLVTHRVKTAWLAFGIVYLILAAAEVYGFIVTYMASIALVGIYSIVGTVAAVVVFGLQVARVATHYALKNDMLTACQVAETNATYFNETASPFDSHPNVTEGEFTPEQALDDCKDQWNRLTWEDFGWLILASLLAVFFSALITAYAHQLRNPNYLRSQSAQAPSQRFQMAPWNRPPPGPPPTEDAPYVPPPPSYPPPPGAPPGFDLPKYEGGGLDTPYPREKDGHGDHDHAPTSAYPALGPDGEPWTAAPTPRTREDTAASERDGLNDHGQGRRGSAEV